MKKFIWLILIFVGTIANLQAQPLRIKNTVINPGEKITYDLYYTLSFIWIPAGTATMNFSLKETLKSKTPVYHASLAGSTVKSFDNFYRVRDTFEVYMDTLSMLPFYYKEVNHEDDYHMKKEYVIKSSGDDRVDFYGTYTKKDRTWKDTVSVKNVTVDLVSVLYRLRNVDLSNIQVNDTLNFTLFTGDQSYDLYLTYKGTEVVKLRNGDRYRCKKFCPLTLDTPLFVKGNDAMSIWVSDDENNLIVAAMAKLKVGSAKVMMKDAAYTRYPITSLIDKKKK